ncbi:TetR/AcrR family transcriptional regulator [Arthrobacter sp. ISL-5]|uniref:TetR/AcrR family transcriptional regulator n=1 Tax=Arthrobacter sp. ISL-5 TaxID=2819111 RepID=UPI001BEC7F09|nr:TetR/AcrR family transcriptional regulator [Arthrobacter sp. ISL-5]MBT2555914.1 TetR family transcriptional regulator [Arthrobacter sp. ISL-5]
MTMNDIPVRDNGRLDISAVRRQQIIMASRKLVSTEGVGAVTIAQIAKVMGTSRGVVNHHFESKEEILRATLMSALKDASAATDQSVAAKDDIGEVTRLVVGLASSENDWWPVYIAFLAESASHQFARKMIQESDRGFRANLAKALGDEARAGVVLGLMKGLALQRVVDDTFDVDEAVAAAIQLLSRWQRVEV